jgi:hypothetical protein
MSDAINQDTLYDYLPGGPMEKYGASFLAPINDRPDPYAGHPYRGENRLGQYRYEDTAISLIVRQNDPDHFK